MTYFTNVVLGDVMVLIIVSALVVCSYLLGKSAGVNIGYKKGVKQGKKENLQLLNYMNKFNSINLRYSKLLLDEIEGSKDGNK